MWKKYRKTALQEMRPYVLGEDLTGVSVADGETPKFGGMIARDAQGSRWYVSPEFMSENYIPDEIGSEIEGCRKFVRHIEDHLEPGEHVICTICGKTKDEIANQSIHPTSG